MNKGVAIFFLAVLASAFVGGVVWLLELRFESGDVYPPYSSLRSDPLGAMALYESLESLPNLSVQRDYRMSNELPYDAGTVYLHLGGQRGAWDNVPSDLYRETVGFLARGGRLVIAFNPEATKPFKPVPAPADKGDTKKPAPSKPVSTDKKKADSDEEADETVSLQDKWGLTFGYVALSAADDSQKPDSVNNISGLPLPATLDWHSGMVFSGLDKSWKTIYARGPDAVIIARQFGPGSVVMVSDSYFFSNEALRKDRQAALLAWLIGANKQVVFDEAHFGIVESPGVMALVRQYHLVGLVAGLLVLGLLFVWMNFFSLVPPSAGEATATHVVGKDATAGFVNLLRRNIPAQDVLGACLAEWKKSAAIRPGTKLTEIQGILESENALPARQRNPVEAYRRITTLLKQPTFKPPTVAPPPSTL